MSDEETERDRPDRTNTLVEELDLEHDMMLRKQSGKNTRWPYQIH